MFLGQVSRRYSYVELAVSAPPNSFVSSVGVGRARAPKGSKPCEDYQQGADAKDLGMYAARSVFEHRSRSRRGAIPKDFRW